MNGNKREFFLAQSYSNLTTTDSSFCVFFECVPTKITAIGILQEKVLASVAFLTPIPPAASQMMIQKQISMKVTNR